jgi:hypothetical protein
VPCLFRRGGQPRGHAGGKGKRQSRAKQASKQASQGSWRTGPLHDPTEASSSAGTHARTHARMHGSMQARKHVKLRPHHTTCPRDVGTGKAKKGGKKKKVYFSPAVVDQFLWGPPWEEGKKRWVTGVSLGFNLLSFFRMRGPYVDRTI